MRDDWWKDSDNVAWLVEWMRNDGYYEHVLPRVAEQPWEWSWQYKRATEWLTGPRESLKKEKGDQVFNDGDNP